MPDARHEVDQVVPNATPPETFTSVGRWHLDTPAGLARVRHAVHDTLTAHLRPTGSVPARTVDRVVLVTSELTTNALTHGRPPVLVELHVDGTALLLEVADHHLDRRPVVAGQRAFGAGGFGLLIAQHLADDVGWYATRTTKHVWAVFDATP